VLKQRIITGIILAPLALAGLFLLDPEPFAYFVAGVILLGAWEWAQLAGIKSQPLRVVYALILLALVYFSRFTPIIYVLVISALWWAIAVMLVLSYPKGVGLWGGKLARLVIGPLLLIPLWHALVFIRSAEVKTLGDFSSLWFVFYMLFLVWAADVGAYFTGKAWGDKKLAPKVSPGKSWAGAWGGLGSVVILAVVAWLFLDASLSTGLILILITVFCGAISIIGDLTESMFKRNAGIKDSSQLLPGHGGVLDRIDSLTAAVPVMTLLLVCLDWVV